MSDQQAMGKLEGRTVMITGASGNLGRAAAQAFAHSGARLFLLDRKIYPLQDLPGAAQGRHLQSSTDLLDAEAVRIATHDALQEFGRIDVLCNLAGGFAMGRPVHETSDADWDALFGINVRSMLNAVRAVVPAMISAGQGKIVNVAAMSALRGTALMGSYCANKDTVIRLTETMAAELRDQNINVNCVLPSIIDTPENRAAMPDADATRWVSADALADVIVFLASSASRALHGAAIPVAGRV
jgi:NAD(P)-dependent dehydrogenase (short-subunit alcohol dehydrogenase family)